MRLAGFILIVVGIVALTYQGITYTKREKVLQVGSLQATVEEEKRIPLPPIVGGFAIAAGLVLVLSKRRTA